MDIVVLAVSLPAGFALSYFFGYSGLTFIFVATAVAILLAFSWIGVSFHFQPPKAEQTWSRAEETVLNLTNKPPHK